MGDRKDLAEEWARRIINRAVGGITATRVILAILVVSLISFAVSFYLWFGVASFLFVIGIIGSLLTLPLVILYVFSKLDIENAPRVR